jgi:hypothetical protein
MRRYKVTHWSKANLSLCLLKVFMDHTNSSFIRRNRILLVACFCLVLYFLPYLLNGQDSHIVIHDNLDDELVKRIVLVQSGHILNLSGNDVVLQVMNGLPRSFMISGLNVIIWIFAIFPPFTAYIINDIIVHACAFLGMYLFLRHQVFAREEDSEIQIWVSLGAAFTFAILPFYPLYGLSTAGVPLLLHAFLQLQKGQAKKVNLAILLIFPFYTFLYYNGFILIGVLFLFLVYDWFANKRFQKIAWGGFIGYVFLCGVSEYDLLRLTLFEPGAVSHRADWNLEYFSKPIGDVLKNILSMFSFGQYHASSHHELILALAIFTLIIFTLRKDGHQKRLVKLFMFQMVIAIIYGFYQWEGLIPLKQSAGIFSSLNLGRVHWLAPFLWYWIFYEVLWLIAKKVKANGWKVQWLIGILIVAQIFVNLSYHSEYGFWINRYIKVPNFPYEDITYRQFYAEAQFQEIRSFIAAPQSDYRVVSIGIFPAIAQYNGFYTLDGYQNSYPLQYKKQFRTVIAPELVKNTHWQEYFDSWGSRCYVFASEIPDFLSTKDKAVAPQKSVVIGTTFR